MLTRLKLISWLAVLSLAVSAYAPASAAGVAGKGLVICKGDGVIVFSGDVVRGKLTTTAGVIVHTTPVSGTLEFADAHGFTKYLSDDVTLHVGAGAATAKNVKDVKVTLSGANAVFEILGKGRLLARGDGFCVFANGQRTTLKTDRDVTIDVTQ
jgi:hypothetical protein